MGLIRKTIGTAVLGGLIFYGGMEYEESQLKSETYSVLYKQNTPVFVDKERDFMCKAEKIAPLYKNLDKVMEDIENSKTRKSFKKQKDEGINLKWKDITDKIIEYGKNLS